MIKFNKCTPSCAFRGHDSKYGGNIYSAWTDSHSVFKTRATTVRIEYRLNKDVQHTVGLLRRKSFVIMKIFNFYEPKYKTCLTAMSKRFSRSDTVIRSQHGTVLPVLNSVSRYGCYWKGKRRWLKPSKSVSNCIAVRNLRYFCEHWRQRG